MAKKTIAKRQTRAIAKKTDPGSLLELAISKGMEMDKLSQLLDIYQRWEAEKAKKAYFEAFSRFQKQCPQIAKNKCMKNRDGQVIYKYADLDEIKETIKEALYNNGFSFDFNQEEKDHKIYITCNLHHRDGHTRSATLSGMKDMGRIMNDLQGIGSTVSYLRRYTLLCVTGVTSADQDDDGKSWEPPVEKANGMKNGISKEALEVGKKLINIMKTDDFTDEERRKFKVWINKNKSAKVRKEKLSELEQEWKVRKETSKKFDEMNNKLDNAIEGEVCNVY